MQLFKGKHTLLVLVNQSAVLPWLNAAAPSKGCLPPSQLGETPFSWSHRNSSCHGQGTISEDFSLCIHIVALAFLNYMSLSLLFFLVYRLPLGNIIWGFTVSVFTNIRHHAALSHTSCSMNPIITLLNWPTSQPRKAIKMTSNIPPLWLSCLRMPRILKLGFHLLS